MRCDGGCRLISNEVVTIHEGGLVETVALEDEVPRPAVPDGYPMSISGSKGYDALQLVAMGARNRVHPQCSLGLTVASLCRAATEVLVEVCSGSARHRFQHPALLKQLMAHGASFSTGMVTLATL